MPELNSSKSDKTNITEYFLEVIKERISNGDTLDTAVRECLPAILTSSGYLPDKKVKVVKKGNLKKGSGKQYTFRGVTGNLAYLADYFGLNFGSIRGSMSYRKWSTEQALTHYYNLKLKRENK